MTSSALLSQAWATAKAAGPVPRIRPNSFLWAVLSPDPGEGDTDKATVGEDRGPSDAA